MIWPAAAAREADTGLDIQVGDGTKAIETLGEEIIERGRVVGFDSKVVSKVPDVDTLVLQRVTMASLATAIPLIQALGIRVVVDIDDDLSTIPRWNAAHTMMQPQVDGMNNWRHLHVACGHADLVTCTTPELAKKFAPHGRVQIIRNRVPAQLLDITKEPRSDDRVLAGWTGTWGMHAGDLPVVGNGVARAVKANGARFRIVGDGRGCGEALGLVFGVEHTGWLPYSGYFKEYAQLDAAIVPLELTPFNRSKSELKGLEAAAVGVPYVATPTPSYRWMRSNGVGLLADRPSEWNRLLSQLLRDEHMRADMAATGRAFAATRTIEGGVDEWVSAWVG